MSSEVQIDRMEQEIYDELMPTVQELLQKAPDFGEITIRLCFRNGRKYAMEIESKKRIQENMKN